MGKQGDDSAVKPRVEKRSVCEALRHAKEEFLETARVVNQ
jgi:hypothetical protein